MIKHSKRLILYILQHIAEMIYLASGIAADKVAKIPCMRGTRYPASNDDRLNAQVASSY